MSKFKIGDRVKLRAGFEDDPVYRGTVVGHATNHLRPVVRYDSGKGSEQNGIVQHDNMLELIEMPTSKFKVGDRVMLRSGGHLHPQSPEYQGTVIRISFRNQPVVQFDSGLGSDRDGIEHYDSKLELIPKPTKFKIGDRVRLVRSVTRAGQGTVIGISPRLIVRYDEGVGSDPSGIRQDDRILELLPPGHDIEIPDIERLREEIRTTSERLSRLQKQLVQAGDKRIGLKDRRKAVRRQDRKLRRQVDSSQPPFRRPLRRREGQDGCAIDDPGRRRFTNRRTS